MASYLETVHAEFIRLVFRGANVDDVAWLHSG